MASEAGILESDYLQRYQHRSSGFAEEIQLACVPHDFAGIVDPFANDPRHQAVLRRLL
jgi:hypothetical protein